MPYLSHAVVPLLQSEARGALEACRGRPSGRQAATALWYEGVSELFGATHAAHGGGLRCRKAELVITGPAKARRHTSANTTYSISLTVLTGIKRV